MAVTENPVAESTGKLICASCGGLPHRGRNFDLNMTRRQLRKSTFSESKVPDWNALPGELWKIIFEFIKAYYVNEHDSPNLSHSNLLLFRTDLFALAFLSKRLLKLVEPFLYADFRWIPDEKVSLPLVSIFSNRDLGLLTGYKRKRSPDFPGEFCHRGPAPFLLLRTLLRRPELVSCIKNMSILAISSGLGIFWNYLDVYEYGFTPAEYALCEAMIRETPHINHTSWLDGLHKGRLDIVIGLLLLRINQFGNLQTIDLRIRDNSTVGNTIFEALSESSSPTFTSIKDVTISVDFYEKSHYLGTKLVPPYSREEIYEMDPYDVDQQVSHFLSLPRLQSLRLFYCCPDPIWQSTLPIAPNLRKVVFSFSTLNEPLLHQFLAATPNLEDLECNLVFDRLLQQFLDGKKLNKALSQVKNTLKRLVLSIDVMFPWEAEDGLGPWNVNGPIGSLQQFQKLEELDIPLILLLPKLLPHQWLPAKPETGSILPSGLKHLRAAQYPMHPHHEARVTAERDFKDYVEENWDWETCKVCIHSD